MLSRIRYALSLNSLRCRHRIATAVHIGISIGMLLEANLRGLKSTVVDPYSDGGTILVFWLTMATLIFNEYALEHRSYHRLWLQSLAVLATMAALPIAGLFTDFFFQMPPAGISLSSCRGAGGLALVTFVLFCLQLHALLTTAQYRNRWLPCAIGLGGLISLMFTLHWVSLKLKL